MKATAIGDLAQTFMLQQRSTQLRASMLRLTQEMSTGIVSDVQSRLGGDFAKLSGLEHRMTIMDGLRVANTEAAGFTEAAQMRLGRVTDTAGELGNSLLALAASPGTGVVSGSADRAAAALEDAVHELNAKFAGRALFAGVSTDSAPLIDAGAILDELRVVAAGAGTAAAAITAVGTWFNDPAGFEATAYQGSTTDLQPFAINEDRSIPYELRADDPAVRAALRDMAAAALVTDPALGLSGAEQAQLVSDIGESLLVVQDDLIGLSANLGVTQEMIERASVRQETERLALEDARNTLLAADPFETATELEAVQFRLESLYAVTVRSSQLSLVNFLR
ncbi:flagellar hook protein [Aestuariivita sp.]|jgi:flagellar hook-associated protein 3 FlgL|uniref:flagellar hook protein n=1 Tax=Aestuariivita sp. TaxID=1872407 RepID=UPI002172AC59|nr:flagellar hook protein [Aestuariivita sp.]MCE8007053.1 flagellar hook protein [Aestuariivita sp.]